MGQSTHSYRIRQRLSAALLFDVNPTLSHFQVGSDTKKGHCRKACGVCIPRKWGAALGVEPIVDTTSKPSGQLRDLCFLI